MIHTLDPVKSYTDHMNIPLAHVLMMLLTWANKAIKLEVEGIAGSSRKGWI